MYVEKLQRVTGTIPLGRVNFAFGNTSTGTNPFDALVERYNFLEACRSLSIVGIGYKLQKVTRGYKYSSLLTCRR